MAGFLTLLPTHTRIHHYRHTHSNTPMTIKPQCLHLFSPQYRTHPTTLDTMDNYWDIKTWRPRYHLTTMGTSTFLLLCWLLRKLSYTLLIKIYLISKIYLSIICASMWSFSSKICWSILPYNPYQGIYLYSHALPHRVPPTRIHPLFLSRHVPTSRTSIPPYTHRNVLSIYGT